MLDWLKQLDRVIAESLRLETYPIAIKMLERKSEIPKNAIRPKKEFGHPISLCEGWAYSRQNGLTVAMLKEDHYCPTGAIVLGLVDEEDPGFKYWLAGNMAPHMAQLPRFSSGKYIGHLTAPLHNTDFQPDIVMMHCNVGQLSQLIVTARRAMERSSNGHPLIVTMYGKDACWVIPKTIQTGTCQVAVPCRGDRQRARATNYEIIFTAPIDKIKDMTFRGREPPQWYLLNCTYKQPETYMKTAKMMGLI